MARDVGKFWVQLSMTTVLFLEQQIWKGPYGSRSPEEEAQFKVSLFCSQAFTIF